ADLAAAGVALPRVALRGLVRRRRAERLEHARPREVLRGDELDLAPLALGLALEERGDLRIDVGETRGAEVVDRFLRYGHDGSSSPGFRRRILAGWVSGRGRVKVRKADARESESASAAPGAVSLPWFFRQRLVAQLARRGQ